MSKQNNRRNHFRLPYPPNAGPVLKLGTQEFRVLELSEQGLRVATESRLPQNNHISGALRFDDGEEIEIEGTMARTHAFTVVKLTRGIGLPRMLAEQRRILAEYPDFLRERNDT